MNYLTLAALSSVLVLTGCVNPDGSADNTGNGALAGGAIGAASGALIGSTRGNAGPGALIGGAIGLIAGGLVGHSMDQDERARLAQQAPQTYNRVEQGTPLGIADVKALTQARVSDDIIISQIRNSHTVYHLSTADIIDLHNSGVSDKVVNYMMNTVNTLGDSAAAASTSTVIVAQAPPPAPVETVVVAPMPGYCWVSGEWVWYGRWVWCAGHWDAPPYAGTIWIGGGWEHENRGWRHAPGHWR